MPDANNKEEILYHNLIDAGCSEQLTKECMSRFKDGTLDKMLPKLAAHRINVLSDMHVKQKQIYCIDYLTNKIKNNEY